MGRNLNGVAAGNGGQRQYRALGLCAGGQAIDHECEVPVASVGRPCSAPGSGSAQSGVGPSANKLTGSPRGAVRSTTTRLLAAGRCECTERMARPLYLDAERNALGDEPSALSSSAASVLAPVSVSSSAAFAGTHKVPQTA